MPREAGDQLGPYQILAPLGAGGMGEVYKARDTRLDRSVAVKVLPDHIAQREDARARFEREARAVASLNHPHICTLHDIGPNYMVMELIDGETLAGRIEKGPIPLEQAVRYAAQIADALDRAHRAGVTHRDIKPHNIMLTRDGVKVLDFGLAKSAPATTAPTEATLTKVLTTEGTVLGTPQYMAPEQFEGREADTRSDIWAFGAVLYELVTGQKAFQGKNYTSLVAAILGGEPAPMAVKPFTPAWLERLVLRCLEKDPDDRWQSMRDIVLELKAPPPETAAIAAKSSRWPWAVAAVLFIAAVAGWGLWLRNRAAKPAPVAMEIVPPKGSTYRQGAAVSPDGRTLAFAASNEKGEQFLYVRPLESLAARVLEGTEGAVHPFWSPDGKSLAFVAGGKLKRIDVAGGAPAALCDIGNSRGADWNEDGVILFAAVAIQRVSSSGGSPVPVTRINRAAGENRHYYPQFLPGGREFLYLVVNDDPAKSGIAFGSIDDKGDDARPAVIVAQTELGARYDADSGRILFIQGRGTLVARRMELHPARLMGDPAVVAEGVQFSPSNGYTDFSLSRQGTLFYGQGSGPEEKRFGWRDRSGKALGGPIGEPVRGGPYFSLSPDGTRAAHSVGSSRSRTDIWVMDLARGLSTRVSFNKGYEPKWSPDGKFLYYSCRGEICRKPADGSGEEVVIAKVSSNEDVDSVSPDGKVLLFSGGDIMKLPLAAGNAGGASKPEPYLKTAFQEGGAAFSPDGRWVAYLSNESGRSEIYIQGYPDKRGRWLVSASGAIGKAVWRRDGRELYWLGQDRTAMVATIELGGAVVRPGRPQPLFQLPPVGGGFDPSPDGQRFLVWEPLLAESHQPSMVLIQNWAARLEK